MDALVTRTPLEGALRVLVAAAATLVATVLLLGAWTPAAHAHTDLVETRPAAGVTDRPLDAVRLTFNEPLAEGLAQVAVTGPRGSVSTGAPVVTGSEVTVALRAPADAATYRIAYRVVAADGHPVVGEFTVTVSRASAAAAAPPSTRDKNPSSGPEVAGSATRGPRSGAPEQLLPAGSGAPVATGGLNLAVTGGAAALVGLLGLHLLLRRTPALFRRAP